MLNNSHECNRLRVRAAARTFDLCRAVSKHGIRQPLKPQSLRWSRAHRIEKSLAARDRGALSRRPEVVAHTGVAAQPVQTGFGTIVALYLAFSAGRAKSLSRS
jgi:hypothetical protein